MLLCFYHNKIEGGYSVKNEYLRVFRAFTDANRFRVLELLCEGEQCACVLLEDLDISQPTLSHHMKILCQSGIVKGRKVGSWNYYSINADGCEYASHLLKIVAQQKLKTTLEFLGIAYRFLRIYKRRTAANMQTVGTGECCCTEYC
jgi:ArsR family transcriptional regulator